MILPSSAPPRSPPFSSTPNKASDRFDPWLPQKAPCTDISTADPLALLGFDLFEEHILPHLDARSLARCTAVCSQWRSLATSDSLWKPLCDQLLTSRAHLPLEILQSPKRDSPYREFVITMRDSRKVELTAEEMCARVWEMRVKPTCGPYWHSLDPTSRGGVPLLRRFHCDQTVRAVWLNDPIWGGNESLWEFVYVRVPDRNVMIQCVRINRWPHHYVSRLADGRWRLDNNYASYTSLPDQKSNISPYLRGVVLEPCASCGCDESNKNVHSTATISGA